MKAESQRVIKSKLRPCFKNKKIIMKNLVVLLIFLLITGSLPVPKKTKVINRLGGKHIYKMKHLTRPVTKF